MGGRAEAYQYPTKTATIASGETKSGSIDLHETAQAGFILPAAFTGTAITFEVSADNVTFAPLEGSDGNPVSLTVSQGNAYAFPISTFPFAFAKIVSGSAEGADRSITICRKY